MSKKSNSSYFRELITLEEAIDENVVFAYELLSYKKNEIKKSEQSSEFDALIFVNNAFVAIAIIYLIARIQDIIRFLVTAVIPTFFDAKIERLTPALYEVKTLFFFLSAYFFIHFIVSLTLRQRPRSRSRTRPDAGDKPPSAPPQ